MNSSTFKAEVFKIQIFYFYLVNYDLLYPPAPAMQFEIYKGYGLDGEVDRIFQLLLNSWVVGANEQDFFDGADLHCIAPPVDGNYSPFYS